MSYKIELSANFKKEAKRHVKKFFLKLKFTGLILKITDLVLALKIYKL